jgi:hypothetical protein
MSLHNNNPVHPFNASYSDQDLINAVRDVSIFLFKRSSIATNDHSFYYRVNL